MSSRDTQRSRVYAAEEFVRTLFDRAAGHSSRVIDFFGAQITLPPEARFASVDSVQRYIDSVLALPAVAVEAAHPDFWRKYVGRRGAVVGIASFGESAPAKDLYAHFGITAQAVAAAARRVLG